MRGMKIRIKGSSIRLRLAKSELSLLMRGSPVEERTSFPGGARFVYRLVADGAKGGIGASFSDGTLVVSAPFSEVERWANSDAVSLHADIDAGAELLSILIEKDFPCLVPREGEDPADRFARPPGEENKSGVC